MLLKENISSEKKEEDESDEELESNFRYEMPEEVRKQFSKSEEVYFDIKSTYTQAVRKGESTKVVLERSIAHHAKICIENSEDVYDALELMKLLSDDINDRIMKQAELLGVSVTEFKNNLTTKTHFIKWSGKKCDLIKDKLAAIFSESKTIQEQLKIRTFSIKASDF